MSEKLAQPAPSYRAALYHLIETWQWQPSTSHVFEKDHAIDSKGEDCEGCGKGKGKEELIFLLYAKKLNDL